MCRLKKLPACNRFCAFQGISPAPKTTKGHASVTSDPIHEDIEVEEVEVMVSVAGEHCHVTDMHVLDKLVIGGCCCCYQIILL